MKILLKILVIILLLFNSIGAFYGGSKFILDPSGSTMQIPLDYLKHSPFHNYLIPGIVLFCVNGLFGLITIVLLLLKHKLANYFVITQGILLGGWIVVQIIMLQTFYMPLHLPFLLIGVILFFSGYFLYKLPL